MTRAVAILILVTLTLGLGVGLINNTRGQPVEVTVQPDTVTLTMNLEFYENVTVLPPININLGSSNSSETLNTVVQPLQTAIQKLVPTASISSLELRARTFNTTKMWYLTENYTIAISGANTNTGSNVASNLAFLALNMTQPITIANQEINAIGTAYILAPLSQQPSSTQFFIDGHQTLNAIIPVETTARFWLLDFTWVQPLPTWTEKSDLLGRTTTWTFTPPGPRYNLTYGPPSPEGTLIRTYEAIYNPTFRISVPANAWINNREVTFDLNNPAEIAMPILVAASLAVLLSTILIDRKITSKPRSMTKKKKR